MRNLSNVAWSMATLYPEVAKAVKALNHSSHDSRKGAGKSKSSTNNNSSSKMPTGPTKNKADRDHSNPERVAEVFAHRSDLDDSGRREILLD